ncbi:FxSxx-COOH system tetratricopeptide repeat protein [Streptomyces phaeofaciens JCM 4814]|uniref:Tetratricopeptide repeat protein n=1 Tax=Streptomyces phaeofaciens TaxID=68254 RepID=A0A918HJS3_9ACTN|nr:tetratricopeptide repeat protein [Streptomyces phaeofaciens]GGT71223.1 tetratricopeptide repeat protein [Streptomyces phaeofaciens]
MTVTAAQGGFAAGSIDQYHRHIHAAPRQPVGWPHQVGAIPPRAEWFQDRTETSRLAHMLAGGGTAVVESAQRTPAGGVLAGMGGVGKTQLAAQYARNAWQAGELDVLVWVTAGSRTAVVSGYAQAAVELLGADLADPEVAARGFLAWLEPKPQEQRCRWLVVLDDVADPGDLRGWWPPASPCGRTVATTRRKDAALIAGGRRLIEVGLFTKDQALTYLADALSGHGRTEPDEERGALADDLGHLPLALSQAVAYLIDTGAGCQDYRALLADRTHSLGEAAPDHLPDDQLHSVAAAWSLSIDHADTLRPPGLARPVLNLAAFLDPNGIPTAVLTSPPALTYLTAHHAATTGPHAGRVTPERVVLALGALQRLSLIDHTPGTPHQAVRVHQLIQRAVRDTFTPDQYQRLARSAADALAAVWPDVERDTDLAQALRANTAVLADCARDALYQPDAHPVVYRAGNSLGGSGQLIAALDYFHRLSAATTQHLGPEHPHSLAARHELARWRGAAGDAAGAVAGAAAALAELLPVRERVLGFEHPDALATRHELARWRGEAGDAAGAVVAMAELLPVRERVLGFEHPDALITRHELARWRGEAGDAAGAVVAMAELLPVRERVLGFEHPDTLATRHELARWRGEAGDAAGAVVAFAELLVVYQRVLGPEHPDALTARHELAYWRGKAGDVGGAVVAFAELTVVYERVLGPEHPEYLIARHNLAYWRGEAGDAAGAVVAMAELLPVRERVLGPEHPHTLITRSNLARWRGEAGDAAGAAAAFAELLAVYQRVLQPEHPDTLTARHNLACWRGEAGDAADAAAGAAGALAELLPVRERVLGLEHPHTLITRHELAYWQGRAGDAAGAAAALAELLPVRERVLGPEHPHTLITRHELAYWQGRAGDAAGAAAAFAELLPVRERVLGPEHRATLEVRRELARWREFGS